MKKILFISVHPDDETLGCGGTILKHKHAKDEIFWLIITAPKYFYTKEFVKKEEKIINVVSKLYGFTKTIKLDFPTQLLDTIALREIIIKIDSALEQIKPNTIYLSNHSDVHSDHKVVFQAVYASAKNFRKPYIEKILIYETLSETEYSPALQGNVFVPNVFVDISKFFEKKMKVMSVYKDELMPDNQPRSITAIKALGTFRGCRIGVNYAEAFMLIFEKC
jgi:N-acetylglucosamine malate deacetylase 1